MKQQHLHNQFHSDFNEFRIHSACSDAFGPKIVSADLLPGTPMDQRSSMGDSLNGTPLKKDPHFSNSNNNISNGTKLVVRNELSERRRSLEYVNRPPSPSHFIQFTAAPTATTNNHTKDGTAFHTEESPNGSEKMQRQNISTIRNGNSNIVDGEKGRGVGFYATDNGHNGSIHSQQQQQGSQTHGQSNFPVANGNRGKDPEKSVSELLSIKNPTYSSGAILTV